MVGNSDMEIKIIWTNPRITFKNGPEILLLSHLYSYIESHWRNEPKHFCHTISLCVMITADLILLDSHISV